MFDVFELKRINIAQGMDLVEWTVDSHKVRLYYPTAIKISSAIRVAAKAAMTLAGGNVTLWRELAKYELEAPFLAVHHEYRRSGHLSNLKSWKVDVQGELVVVQLDELTAKLHCTDALQLQAWMNVAARNAKAWAGDDSTAFVMTARLTNATPDRKTA